MMKLIESTMNKASAIYELAKRIGNSELALEISDLKLKIAEIQTDYANLQNENRYLKEKIRSLENDKNEQPILKNGIYYLNDGTPCCSGCYGKDKKIIPLSYVGMGIASHICPVCDAPYNIDS